ncbi:MAG: S8 family serine peptidase [Alphaproteobacteria bacterium]|nr:S8 family serine peptidase [Alphaproteobacteria bacterium]
MATEPQRFNEKMWDLIRANPEAREQIMSEAIRLSLTHEIAVHPNNKEEILAKFKKLYPQYADRLEDYALSEQPESLEFSSFKDTNKVRVFAEDPETAPTGSRTSWFGRNWPWVLLAGGGGGGAAIAIASSSSSSSSGSDTPSIPVYTDPPTVGEQQEYNNQSGLDRINAGDANLAGFTGTGITVAVIDSGVNIQHPDLKNQLATGGFDFVHDTGTVTDTDTGFYHGTHVAGIIAAQKNDFGIRGVAYNAKILPLAAINPDSPTTAITDAVARAKAQGAKVINASYGPNDTANELFVQNGAQFYWNNALTQATAYLDFANNGGILVFAAGNSYTPGTALINNHPTGGGFLPFVRPANKNIAIGQPGAYRYSEDGVTLSTLNADYSALEGKLIVAVALETDNTTIASFSNRCGVTKDWCIAAPGVAINSTSGTNTYSELDGTSFAAPHVSGAIAVLLEQHPELTPTQVVNLLLNTATDIGTAGVDDVFGHGALNLAAAQQSSGPFMVVTGANMSGNQILLNNSSVHASPAFGASFVKALGSTNIGILDGYTRNFTVSLNQRVQSRLSTVDGLSAMQRFGQNEFRPSIAIDDKSNVSFTLRPKDGVQRVSDKQQQGSLVNSYNFTHQLGSDVAMSVSHNDARANALSFNESDRSLLSSQVTGNGVGNPYLDFVADGYANNVTMDLPWEGRFRATAAMGAAAEDSGQRNMLTMAEVGFGDESRAVTLTTGAMIEQNRLLGLQGTGAFGLGQGTTTWFSGISGRWQVAPKTEVIASFYGGVTNGKTANDSLVRGIESVTSTTWRVGLSQSDVAQDGDRFRFNVAQPLRAEGGAMNLSLPQYRLQDGTIVRQDARFGLAPSGREIDFEAGYSFTVDDASKVDLAAMYRRDAGHVAGKSEAIGVTRFSRGF